MSNGFVSERHVEEREFYKIRTRDAGTQDQWVDRDGEEYRDLNKAREDAYSIERYLDSSKEAQVFRVKIRNEKTVTMVSNQSSQ
jgi:hypothetical protein